MNSKTYHFKGSIKTLEPFTVSLAKTGEIPTQNGIAYIPESTLNGALRKCALDYIISNADSDEGKEKLFNLDTYFSQAQGVIINNDVKDLIDKSATSTPVDKDIDLRTANPFLSLFGRWKLGGKWGLGNAYTTSEDQLVKLSGGFRSAIFERNPDLLKTLNEGEVERYIKLQANQKALSSDVNALKKQATDLKKKYTREVDEAVKTAISNQINDLEQQIKGVKNASDEGKEIILRPLDNVSAIAANSALKHRMTLTRATDVELGCMLITLGQFSLNPRIGGKQRSNFGLVEMDWEVFVSNPETFGRDKIGRVKISDDGLVIEGEDLKEAMKAFRNGSFDFSRII
ncbi:hypothetical protein DZF72_06490 [Vibrio parahaemolyticus]|nr:hypothetical protein [Vibrio parahaemolyticus]